MEALVSAMGNLGFSIVLAVYLLMYSQKREKEFDEKQEEFHKQLTDLNNKTNEAITNNTIALNVLNEKIK